MIQNLLQIFTPHAHAYTYFDLGDVASTSLAYAGAIVSDLGPAWKLVFGVLLGVAVVGFIIYMIRK